MKPDLLLLMRERAGLTQSTLADRLDVTQSTISNVERGQRTPSLELLESWAEACGYEVVVLPTQVAKLLDVEGIAARHHADEGPKPAEVVALRPSESAAINLRSLRRDAELTQQDVAEALGIGRSYVSKLERGAAEVDLSLAQRWARVCGREIGLLDREDPPATAQRPGPDES